MKKIFLLLFLTTSQTFAGTPNAFKAVLDLEEVKSLIAIEKIAVKTTFRCPQCFKFCVQGIKKATDEKPTTFSVSTHFDEEKQEVVAQLTSSSSIQ